MSETCIPHITLIPYSAVGSYQKVLELWGGGEGGGNVLVLWRIHCSTLSHLGFMFERNRFIKKLKKSIMEIDINRHGCIYFYLMIFYVYRHIVLSNIDISTIKKFKG